MSRSRIERQAKACVSTARLRQAYAPSKPTNALDADAIVSALQQFQECVRYLNTRRSSGAVLSLNSEADVQDAVYLMLRPWVHDLTSENPTDRVANRYVIKDFISPAAETVVEVKYVRDASHGKQLAKEMHDDIETYRHHPRCRNIVFFVYDPDSLIPDSESLRIQIEESRSYGDRPLRCVLVVKP